MVVKKSLKNNSKYLNLTIFRHFELAKFIKVTIYANVVTELNYSVKQPTLILQIINNELVQISAIRVSKLFDKFVQICVIRGKSF